MSENLEKSKRIAGIFADQYNAENGTSYAWVDEKSWQPGEPYDVMLFDDKGVGLGVQIVEAVGSERTEKQIPAETAKVITQFKQSLEAAGYKELSIMLVLRAVPSKKDLAILIEGLKHIFVSKVKERPHELFFEFDMDDDWLMQEIRQWVKLYTIMPLPGHGGVHFAFSCWEDIPQPLFDDEQRVLRSALKKEQKYNDVLIVIDSGESPIQDMYIPAIKESVGKLNLKEVWVVDDFTIPAPRAFNIKK